MTQITSQRIVELIEKSKLVDARALKDRIESMRVEHGGELPEDPVEFCKAFETVGLLTRWQSEKLMQGKYKGFFLGKHKLLGHIGTGGMSAVYLAEHTVMRHRRAIKVLPKSKLGKSSYLERFRREAKAIASLNHPNVVRAYDIDNERDTHYLVMEYVEGPDLQILVKKHGPLPYAIAADYISQAALGLQHAHDLGLIHRDVKPANLLVDSHGVVKVLDMGLALFTADTDASITMEYNDKVLGTADYLAPEQALNSHNVDSRADIYGLGCTLYFLLTGHPPFPDGSIASRIAKHQQVMPKDIRKERPDCPGELEGICVKMIQKDPRFRYTSCQQVSEVLQNWLLKYRKENPHVVVKPPEGMSIDELLEVAKSRNSSTAETVSNRGAKTMGGQEKPPAIVSLSSSDSGILRTLAQGDGSSVDSHIDLVNDSNQPSIKQPKAQAIAKATDDSQSSPGKSSPLHKPMDAAAKKPGQSGPKNPAPASKSGSNKPPQSPTPQTSNRALLAIAVVIAIALFIVVLIVALR
ncbi:MAG: serine/threonine protein kinase [Planctomycetes bacterium]|nr:serine/threonine protein kinase [Planctomycetota bacterium]